MHTYIRAVGKQALTRYTRKGYAYTGVSQSQEVVFQISFADYLDVNLIRIFDTILLTRKNIATQPLLPLELSLHHDAFAKVRNKLEIKKEKGEKFENNVGMTIFLPKSLHLSEIVRIFATSNVCLTIRVESREGKTSPTLPILKELLRQLFLS